MPAPEWALLQRELLPRPHRGLRDLPRQVLRRTQSPAVLPALGHERRTGRRHRARERLADAACAGRIGRILELYRAVYEGHLEQYSALRTKDVPMGRQGMYYASSRRRWTGSTSAKDCPSSTHGAVDAGRRQAHRTHAPLRGLLRRQRSGGAQLRQEASRHPQHVQRQHGPLLRRPPRSTGPAIPSTPRVSSSSTANATTRSSSRTSRNTPTPSATPAEPAIHHARAQCLSIDRREALARMAAVVRRRVGRTRRRQRRHPAEQGRARRPHRRDARAANGTRASTAGRSARSFRRPASARIATACRAPSWAS